MVQSHVRHKAGAVSAVRHLGHQIPFESVNATRLKVIAKNHHIELWFQNGQNPNEGPMGGPDELGTVRVSVAAGFQGNQVAKDSPLAT